jgi:ribose transport system permease protein
MSAQQGAVGMPKPGAARPLRTLVTDYGLILVLIVVVIAFSLLRPSTYFTATNLQMIASTNAVLAVLALAAVPPLVTGQFDLSIGFQLALAQSLAATLIIDHGLSPGLVAVIVLALGLVIGLVNGLLVAYGGLNAFITTLATGILLQGASQLVTNGESIFGRMPAWWLSLGRSELWMLPLPIVYVVVACALLWLALEYTSWGRRCFATGGNPRAALLVGIPVRSIVVQSFVLAGGLCAIAGLLSTSILGSANPNIGANYMLPAFAAVFLGATSIRPGRFNAWGTVIAVYALAAGIDGLQQFGAPFYIEQFFNGGALLLAISLAKFAGWRRTKKPAAAQ